MLLRVILILIVAFILYRLTRRCYPKVYVNNEGEAAAIIAQMKTLEKPYRPTPWLIGPNIHTIWGMRYRKSSKLVPRRDTFIFSDGGTAIFDWFESEELDKSSPVLIIVHTLAGGTREACTNNMAESALKKGYRVVVANTRGCSGAPITSDRFLNAYEIDDLEALIKHIHEDFTPSHIFMVGFSLGGMQAVQYCITDPKVDGVVSVSHTYVPNVASDIIEKPVPKKLYLSVIMSKLSRILGKSQQKDHPARKAKTLREFDSLFTAPRLGYASAKDYYEAIAITGKLLKAKVPMAVIGSTDDPFTAKNLLPIEEAKQSTRSCLITVSEGGHVSFCTGMDGQRSWVEEVVLDWFEQIKKQK